MSQLKKFLSLTVLFLLAAGCVRPGPPDLSAATNSSLPATASPTQLPPSTSTPAPSAAPSPSPPAAPVPTVPPTTPADSGWETLRPGLERRTIEVRDAAGLTLERLLILRLDPAEFTFRVEYEPLPQTLEVWLANSGALIALNGGYYRSEGEALIPTGLTIAGGAVIGESYGDFAGMLAVSDAGAGLRWLALSPYDPGENLTSALQSFPLLVKPGGELGFPAELEDYQAARRTVIAQDRAGYFLLMVAPRGAFTLHQLSVFLIQSDLDLEIALNLDGGPSSGLLLADPPQGETALVPLPVVILVFPR